jgi:hypothetical protein
MERAAARACEVQEAEARAKKGDVDRWPALPGQTRGDAKDPLVQILEKGFNPERFRADPEYQARPEIQALGEKWLRIVSERERAARVAARTEGHEQATYEANKSALERGEQAARLEVDRNTIDERIAALRATDEK